MLSLELDKIKHDLVLKGGNFVINNNSNSVAQLIKTRLKTIAREWFLNSTIGVDYFNKIFADNSDLFEIESIFKSEILNTTNVKDLLDFDIKLNRATRHLTINFKCSTDFNGIIEESLNIDIGVG